MTYEITGVAPTKLVDNLAVSNMNQSHLKVVTTEKSTKGLVDKSTVEDAVIKVNEFLSPTLQTVKFSIDEETDKVVVKVIDTETQNVLRQIPVEAVLNIAKTFDRLKGMVISISA